MDTRGGQFIFIILAALQAYRCRGQALIPTNIVDFAAVKTDQNSFIKLIGSLRDISEPITTKSNGKSRSWLYAAVSAGDLDKVKHILYRLKEALNAKQKLKKPDFPNLPDDSSSNGHTPLTKAIQAGANRKFTLQKDFNEIVKTLLDSEHIDPTRENKQGISPLRMAAICNNQQAFALVWYAIIKKENTNKANAEDKIKADSTQLQHLFKQDKEGHSVFASAYLPDPGFFGSNASLNMFKAILEIVNKSLKANLNTDNLDKIIKEIMDLQHKGKIRQKYASKLQNEVNLIKHPKPSEPSAKKGKGSSSSEEA